MSEAEVWLRGALPGYIDELQPVAHSLLQVREEIQRVAALPPEKLWARPGGAASIGFHLKHLAGSLDRLLTYAGGKPLSPAQYAALAGEERESAESAQTLVDQAQAAIDRALTHVRTTPLCTLDETREVGRDRLPSTVLGLLFHAAEHAQRHAAQIITTAKVVSVSQREWLRDLYRHQEWADAEHWRLLAGFEPARNDEGVRARLHHIHMVQHAFRWILGDRTSPIVITTPADFSSFDALHDFARAYHAQVDADFDALTDERLMTSINIEWFKDPPLSITVAEALTQCVMHSQHHRGQNAARLRELGGVPENTDYIVWLWEGTAGAGVVTSPTRDNRSPTPALLVGLIVTLAAVVGVSWYPTRQISGLRALQTDLADRNRTDSLQLLRIQNDLNSLGLAMRDMLDTTEPYPLTAWTAQFARIRGDLDSALAREAEVAGARRTPEQSAYLGRSLAQFWDAADRIFALAAGGREADAREQIRLSLQARQAALNTAVARLLVENNASEEETAAQVRDIYRQVQRQVYIFLGATFIAIALTSSYLIRANRQLFARLSTLSNDRRELAQQLIATRESTLREISRELHDEFGQVLTAMGSMLGRAGKHAPDGSPLRAELREIGEIAQTTLDNVRGLSQTLHPSILEEAGLERTVDWYLSTVERQMGLTVTYERPASPVTVDSEIGIHVYRVLQESLSNVARHSGVTTARVRLDAEGGVLQLDVEDHGKGIGGAPARRGLGIVAMRERAALVGGTIEFLDATPSGTLIRMRYPFMADAKITVLLADDHSLVRRGFRRMLEDDEAIEVVGEAANGDEAIEMTRRLSPAVVVMDVAMPGTNGLAATKAIVAEHPAVAVLMLSMHAEATLVRQALDNGARGYVLKNALDLDLAAAVKKVAAGETVLDPSVNKPAALKGERTHALTPREFEVLQLICAGLSNRDIAEKLDLSVNTVAVHRANIMHAIGVHKTAELVVYAITNGLVTLP